MSQQSVEDLIRDTLTDPRRRLEPPPGHYQLVGEQIGRVRRQRHWRRAGAVAAVVALLVGGGLAAQRPRTVPAPYLGPSPATTTARPYGEWHALPQIGPGEPIEVVSGGAFFYLLEESPGTLLMLDSSNLAVVRSVAVPERPQSLAVDQAGDGTWVTYTRPDGVTMAREYSESFAPVRDVPVTDRQVFDAVALDGQLWLAAGDDLYRVGPSDTAAQPVPGLTGGVTALALDSLRHRLIYTASPATTAEPGASLQMNALDPATMAVTTGATLPLVKVSIAMVANHLWVAGFASGNDQPRIYQLDPVSLTIVGTSEVNGQVGPGAIVSGGYDSLWVQDGADDGLSCVNPVTGVIRQQWLVNVGTVASKYGPLALGVHQPNLVRLALSGCPG